MGLTPCIFKADNGMIERCNLALQIAGEVAMVLEYAPKGDAHAKPVVESHFKVLNDRLLHRLVITTKGSPEARGAHDPDAEALEREITADRFERALMQWYFDVYAATWHGGLRERPQAVLRDGLGRFAIRQWGGSADALRRMLRRDEGLRKVGRKGVHYRHNHWYSAAWLRDRIDTMVRIKVDEDDLRTVDAYDEDGNFLGVLRCGRLADAYDRPVPRWELDLLRAAERKFASGDRDAAAKRTDEIVSEMGAADEKRAARKAHARKRAAETTTEDIVAALSTPVGAADEAKPAAPRAFALPVPVDRDYEPLIPTDTAA